MNGKNLSSGFRHIKDGDSIPRRIDNIVGNPHDPGDPSPEEEAKKTIYSEPANRLDEWTEGTITKSTDGGFEFTGEFKLQDGTVKGAEDLTEEEKRELWRDFEKERRDLNKAYGRNFKLQLRRDGIVAGCDSDADEDLVFNAGDNCPAVPNPLQLDGDDDRVGDACDLCPTVPGSVESYGCPPEDAIPVLGMWSAALLIVGLLAAGALILRRRSSARASNGSPRGTGSNPAGPTL